MEGVRAADLFAVWERGDAESPAQRALALLLLTDPRADPVTTSVGNRDARLLGLCTTARGPALAAEATCPGCGEALELEVDAAELAGAATATVEPELTWQGDGYAVRFRAPTAVDVAALPRRGEPSAGRALLERCVVAAAHNGSRLEPAELPPQVIAAVEEAMSAADPGAEIILSLACPACAGTWTEVLDPSTFAWAAVEETVLRLVDEVHALALAYGWREEDILALSPARRRLYLEALAV